MISSAPERQVPLVMNRKTHLSGDVVGIGWDLVGMECLPDREILEPERGFEPRTSALQERRSGQLSYPGGAGTERGRKRLRWSGPAERMILGEGWFVAALVVTAQGERGVPTGISPRGYRKGRA
jgi:hypothetical protein